MRVLLCERVIKGHRKTYLDWLSKIQGIEAFVYASEADEVDDMHFIEYTSPCNLKSIKEYIKWIHSIRRISDEKEIDIVHILDGDSIMRFFGLGFDVIKAPRMIITYHHFFDGAIRKLAYKMMCFGKKRLCVVHTKSVYEKLQNIGIKNIEQCDYPAFTFERISNCDSKKSKAYYGLSEMLPVVGIVGGICQYKNIVPYLESLDDDSVDFQILICGKTQDVGEEEIRNAVSRYSDRVKIVLRRLSEEEYEMAIAASDIVYCIYNHTFDGASGPLTDAVCANKQILACEHGSLGQIVTENHLGKVADCLSAESMRAKTIEAVNDAALFEYDSVASNYRASLNPRLFQEKYNGIYLKK